MTLQFKVQIMNEADINRAMLRVAHEILEHNKGAKNLALVGIHTRGVPISVYLADKIEEIEGHRPELGKLDITLYRDDLTEVAVQPIVKRTEFPFDVQGKDLVLCDDVIYTGRTVRAALDAVIDLGRPASIQFATLVDRGHRELPIRPDYIGKNIPTSRQEVVKVKLHSIDGAECVELWESNRER